MIAVLTVSKLDVSTLQLSESKTPNPALGWGNKTGASQTLHQIVELYDLFLIVDCWFNLIYVWQSRASLVSTCSILKDKLNTTLTSHSQHLS